MQKVFVVVNDDDEVVGVMPTSEGWQDKLLTMISDETGEVASYAKDYLPIAPDTLGQDTRVSVQLDEFEYDVRIKLAVSY